MRWAARFQLDPPVREFAFATERRPADRPLHRAERFSPRWRRSGAHRRSAARCWRRCRRSLPHGPLHRRGHDTWRRRSSFHRPRTLLDLDAAARCGRRARRARVAAHAQRAPGARVRGHPPTMGSTRSVRRLLRSRHAVYAVDPARPAAAASYYFYAVWDALNACSRSTLVSYWPGSTPASVDPVPRPASRRSSGRARVSARRLGS